MRQRCHFKHNGHPTTQPGTDDDEKRIALSQWITALLVRDGEEQPGEYQTPGANGYASWEIKAAKKRLAPVKPKPKEKSPHEKPVGKRIKPPLPEVTVPRNDEWQLLSERFSQLGKLLGNVNNRIKSLTKPD